jgi:BT1 family
VISDRFPIFGYRRRSWFILMASLGFIFWIFNALMAFLDVRIPIAYLIGFNLAFSTYAFVDVVSDAIMVEQGRRLRRVASFINFQWTMLSLSNAAVTAVSGWFQGKIQQGEFAYWMIFLATGLPPLVTAVVGFLNIPEERLPASKHSRTTFFQWQGGARAAFKRLRSAPAYLSALGKENKLMMILVLFIVLWNFSPSVGYIERSYLIDARGFTPAHFGAILTLQALTFLVSILAYRWIVHRWPSIQWYHYLFAMIALMIIAFPLSFYFYLDPDHRWWSIFAVDSLAKWNPLPEWNRYVWFRLVFSVLFGFATIPAFMIPLRIAGEAVKLKSAGMSYAFLMALSNVTNTFEGLVGSGLYWFFTQPWAAWLVDLFHRSPFDIADVADQRTIILQLFIYISLFFTLLTIPVVLLLKRTLARYGIEVTNEAEEKQLKAN